MPTERAVHTVRGRITVVQEQRFRLSDSQGRSYLFTLSHRAPLSPDLERPPVTHSIEHPILQVRSALEKAHTGITPCLRHGRSTFFVDAIRRPRMIVGRVSLRGSCSSAARDSREVRAPSTNAWIGGSSLWTISW